MHMYVYALPIPRAHCAQIARASACGVPNEADGTISMANIRASIRNSTSIHQPRTRLICLENTHNLCGGVVLPDGYVQQVGNMLHTHCLQHKLLQVRELADAQTPAIAIHMDGARLMNASVVTGQSISELCRHVHSVTFSMCKVSIVGHTVQRTLCVQGVGAPVGAVLGGSCEFIAQ